MRGSSSPRAPLLWRWTGAQLLFLTSISALAAPPERAALCESCHGPGGNSTTANIPSLAGQPPIFIENQLVYFREGLRNAPVMQPLMQGVKDEEITALAKHFSAQAVKPSATSAVDPKTEARAKDLVSKMH